MPNKLNENCVAIMTFSIKRNSVYGNGLTLTRFDSLLYHLSRSFSKKKINNNNVKKSSANKYFFKYAGYFFKFLILSLWI